MSAPPRFTVRGNGLPPQIEVWVEVDGVRVRTWEGLDLTGGVFASNDYAQSAVHALRDKIRAHAESAGARIAVGTAID